MFLHKFLLTPQSLPEAVQKPFFRAGRGGDSGGAAAAKRGRVLCAGPGLTWGAKGKPAPGDPHAAGGGGLHRCPAADSALPHPYQGEAMLDWYNVWISASLSSILEKD